MQVRRMITSPCQLSSCFLAAFVHVTYDPHAGRMAPDVAIRLCQLYTLRVSFCKKWYIKNTQRGVHIIKSLEERLAAERGRTIRGHDVNA
jgi:hypothetical protein